jgi:5,5'-dehydrodivanillate O-demethylase
LRSSDLGIAEMRKRFFADMDKVAKGEDPSATLRDPAAASCVKLPDVMRKYNVEGVPLADYDKHPLLKERLAGFRHHYGQPAEVRRAFEQAMGI